MSVQCNESLAAVQLTGCQCSQVDFDVTLTNVCSNSRYGVVANVVLVETDASGTIISRTIVGTACQIVNTGTTTTCECITTSIPVEFRNVIIDVQCCEDLPANTTLTVEAYGNYIFRCNNVLPVPVQTA
jgi:hypothetical protein